MIDEIEILGICAFCVNACHDFNRDAWHEVRHDEGWHTCKLDGCFRQSKPLCQRFELNYSDAVFVA